AFPRQVSILRVDFVVNRGCYALEILRGRKGEATEENAAVSVQFLVDVVAVVASPLGQIHLVGGRFHHQRQWLFIAELLLANWIEVREINGFAAYRSQGLLCGQCVFHDSPSKMLVNSKKRTRTCVQKLHSIFQTELFQVSIHTSKLL